MVSMGELLVEPDGRPWGRRKGAGRSPGALAMTASALNKSKIRPRIEAPLNSSRHWTGPQSPASPMVDQTVASPPRDSSAGLRGPMSPSSRPRSSKNEQQQFPEAVDVQELLLQHKIQQEKEVQQRRSQERRDREERMAQVAAHEDRVASAAKQMRVLHYSYKEVAGNYRDDWQQHQLKQLTEEILQAEPFSLSGWQQKAARARDNALAWKQATQQFDEGVLQPIDELSVTTLSRKGSDPLPSRESSFLEGKSAPSLDLEHSEHALPDSAIPPLNTADTRRGASSFATGAARLVENDIRPDRKEDTTGTDAEIAFSESSDSDSMPPADGHQGQSRRVRQRENEDRQDQIEKPMECDHRKQNEAEAELLSRELRDLEKKQKEEEEEARTQAEKEEAEARRRAEEEEAEARRRAEEEQVEARRRAEEEEEARLLAEEERRKRAEAQLAAVSDLLDTNDASGLMALADTEEDFAQLLHDLPDDVKQQSIGIVLNAAADAAVDSANDAKTRLARSRSLREHRMRRFEAEKIRAEMFRLRRNRSTRQF